MTRHRASRGTRAARAFFLTLTVLALMTPGTSVSAQAPAQASNPGPDMALIREFAGERAFTKPSRDAIMGFSLPTQITEVFVKGGQEVKKGDPLVKGDDSEDQALLRLQKLRAETDLAVQRAKITRDLAETEFKRVQEMQSKGGSSPQEFDRSRLSLQGAEVDYQTARLNQTQEQIQVDRLEARIARFRLAAPFDGEVDLVHVDAGQAVSENEKVVRVVNVDLLWVDVPASMKELQTLQVKVNDPAWALLETAGKYRVAKGKVIEVSPVADAASRTRRVRVEIQNPKGPERVVGGEPAWIRFTAPDEGTLKLLSSK